MQAFSHPKHSNKMIKLFNSQEYEELYGVPTFNDESRAEFFSLTLDDKKLLRSFKSNEDQIYFILSLGYFRATRCLIDFAFNAVKSDWQYVRDLYFKEAKVSKKLPDSRQRNRIQNKILQHENAARWNNQLHRELEPVLAQLVQRHPKTQPVVKSFLDHLNRRGIALPAYSTLQRVITRALTYEKERLFQICKKNISLKDKSFIESLLKEETSFSPLTSIKVDVKDFSYTELSKELKKQEYLRPLFRMAIPILEKSGLPKKTIEYYGSLVNFYSLYKLKRMPPYQAYWYLLCYSFTRYQKVNDNLVQFFKHYVNTFHEESKEHSQEELRKLQLKMEALLVKAGHVLQLFTKNNAGNSVEQNQAFKILPKKEMVEVEQFLLGHTSDEDLFYWEHIDSLRHRIRMHLRPIFWGIDFTTIKETELNSLFPIMKTFLESSKDLSQEDAEAFKELIPKGYKAYLFNSYKTIHKDRFEFFFYKKIALHIETHKITLSYSQKYKALKEEMINGVTWEKEKSTILKGLGYPKLVTPVEQLLTDYKQELNTLLESVNERIDNGENKHVKVKLVSEGSHWSLPYQRKEEIVNNPFFLQLPPINIVDILYFVDQECGFLKYFTPIQAHSIKQSKNNPLLIAAILGNAVRMGSYKMASCAHLNLQELLTIEKTYLRIETLRTAIDTINNATAKLNIFPYWDINGKLHSSLDGSKIGTRLQTLKSRYSPKYYGLEKGVSAYNHLTNNLSTNARSISPNDHESHFAFPIVYNDTSEINPLHHSGDGHSINQVNFTLFDIIGHQFMPHFPGIQKKPIYCFGPTHKYKNAIIKPSKQIHENLIIKEWPDIQHILASILQNETDPSTLIAKLSSHKYYSKTKEALWEYDNILKSIYLLHYIDDIEIRQGVRKALNRGESYHQLYRAISYINGGRFRGKTELEIEVWNECTRLIASAIIHYNAYILSLLLNQTSNAKLLNLITQLSPIAWSHINLLGQYEFDRQHISLEIVQWIRNLKLDLSKIKV